MESFPGLDGEFCFKTFTFTDAGFLAEVVALWAFALEAPKSVDAVSPLAETW